MCVRHKAEKTEYKEHGAETHETVQVEGSAANTDTHQEPSTKHTDHVNAVLSQGKVIRFRWSQASLFQEVPDHMMNKAQEMASIEVLRGVTGERVSAQILNCPNHADNLSPTSIGSPEAIEVSGTFGYLVFQR